MRTTILFLISSFLFVGCAVQRPQTDAWTMNGPGGFLEGYNIHDDYDDNGVLRPGAKKKYFYFKDSKDLNSAIIILPKGKVEGDEGTRGLKTWMTEMRSWVKDHCQ